MVNLHGFHKILNVLGDYIQSNFPFLVWICSISALSPLPSFSLTSPTDHLVGRTNNSAILQLLLSFTGSLCEPGVQSLVSEAIATCPDLLTPYLGAVGVSFEPRPNSKWIDNVDFLNRVSNRLSILPTNMYTYARCVLCLLK